VWYEHFDIDRNVDIMNAAVTVNVLYYVQCDACYYLPCCLFCCVLTDVPHRVNRQFILFNACVTMCECHRFCCFRVDNLVYVIDCKKSNCISNFLSQLRDIRDILTRVKKTRFFKKAQPSGFYWFFGFYWVYGQAGKIGKKNTKTQ